MSETGPERPVERKETGGADSSAPPEPDDYLTEHVRQALARDPRISELGVQVSVKAGKVFLTGDVPTAERRDAITALTRELLPDREVHNNTTVVAVVETGEAERLS